MSRVQVVFDATPLALRDYSRGGAYRYGLEIARRVPRFLPPDWEFRLYFNFFRGSHRPRLEEALGRAGAPRHVWSRVHPRLLRLLHAPAEWTVGPHDLFHGGFDRVPPTRRAARVVTIQDLAFLRAPEGLPAAWVRELRRTVPASARRAHRILTGSEFSKADLVELLQVSPAKVQVIPHGVDSSWRPPADPDADRARLRGRYGISSDYILYVGTLQPNKNLEGLCAAFQILRRRGYAGQLVLAGSPGWLFGACWERIAGRGHDQAVLRTGFVDEADLPRLYGACSVFALVSRLEGFGIPVLEAMACGAPVVAAAACSLPEVAGGAAWLVDPGDPEAIAAGLQNALEPGPERERRRALGLARAALYSWERCAVAHVAAYQETLKLQEAG